MTREGLIEVMARAQARSAWDRSYRSDPNFSELYLTRWPGGVEEYLEQKWPLYVPDVRAALAAIEAAGVRLVNFAALAEDDAAVEKVARALCVDDDVDPDAVGYDRTGRDLPNWYVVQGTARAALRALGE